MDRGDRLARERRLSDLVAVIDDLGWPVLCDVLCGTWVALEVVLTAPARVAASHDVERLDLLGDQLRARQWADRGGRRVEEGREVLLVADPDHHHAAVGLCDEGPSVDADDRRGRRRARRCERRARTDVVEARRRRPVVRHVRADRDVGKPVPLCDRSNALPRVGRHRWAVGPRVHPDRDDPVHALHLEGERLGECSDVIDIGVGVGVDDDRNRRRPGGVGCCTGVRHGCRDQCH